MIIKRLYQDDLLSEEERDAYKYGLEEYRNNYLAGKILSRPDLSKAPKNERVRRRIYHYLSTLFMDMDAMPAWEQLYLFSVITPCFEEVITYPFAFVIFAFVRGIDKERSALKAFR